MAPFSFFLFLSNRLWLKIIKSPLFPFLTFSAALFHNTTQKDFGNRPDNAAARHLSLTEGDWCVTLAPTQKQPRGLLARAWRFLLSSRDDRPASQHAIKPAAAEIGSEGRRVQENEMGAQCVFGCVCGLVCARGLSICWHLDNLSDLCASVSVSVCALRLPARCGNTVT